jgi:hypothetical protein
MKMQISLSSRLTAKLLIAKMTGSYHAGMQKVSNINGSNVLWNYVTVKNGRYETVLNKEDAVGIVASGKFYKLESK